MFPFDLSFQDIFIVGVVLTVAGGTTLSTPCDSATTPRHGVAYDHTYLCHATGYKEQFLRYSRQGGMFVGRAVGFIRQKRDQVFTSTAQKAEMEALQQQLSDAMAQMQFIRHDIRSSTRLSRYCILPQPSVQHDVTTAEGVARSTPCRAYMSQGGNGAPVSEQGMTGSQYTSHPDNTGAAETPMPFQPSNPLAIPQTTPKSGPLNSSPKPGEGLEQRPSHASVTGNDLSSRDRFPYPDKSPRSGMQQSEAAAVAVEDHDADATASVERFTNGAQTAGMRNCCTTRTPSARHKCQRFLLNNLTTLHAPTSSIVPPQSSHLATNIVRTPAYLPKKAG